MKQLICCQNCAHDKKPAHIRPCAECYRDGTLRKFEANTQKEQKPTERKEPASCSC